MDRPSNIREETWKWILQNHVELDEQNLGKSLFEAGIILRPDLLQDSVIQIESMGGADFIIDLNAAIELQNGKEIIYLSFIGEKEKHAFLINEIIESFKTSHLFDQLSIKK